MPYVKPKTARKHLGISNDTLKKWGDSGKIPTRKLPSGHRLYNIQSFFTEENSEQPKNYIYCRVSSSKQKEDLQRQVQVLREKYPDHTVVQEIASGINFKRKGLNKIMAKAIQGEVKEIVVAYKDRLCRIAWDHFEWLFNKLGVRIVVDNNQLQSKHEELTDDLLSIIHVFSCRHYGARRSRRKKTTKEHITEIPSEKGKYDS